ncbi:hypothetical protein OGAPHI_006555, partial [Ogataea philodendri]
NWSRAAQAIDQLLEGQGGNASAKALIMKATALLKMDRHEDAIDTLKQASNSNPSQEDQSAIELLIKTISSHVVQNMNTTNSRDLGDGQSRDLTSTLLSGLM